MVVVAGFIYGALSVVVDSVKFDLRVIGESVYQAHARDRVWPRSVNDLEGTAHLQMPQRRELIDKGVYVVVWPEDLHEVFHGKRFTVGVTIPIRLQGRMRRASLYAFQFVDSPPSR